MCRIITQNPTRGGNGDFQSPTIKSLYTKNRPRAIFCMWDKAFAYARRFAALRLAGRFATFRFATFFFAAFFFAIVLNRGTTINRVW